LGQASALSEKVLPHSGHCISAIFYPPKLNSPRSKAKYEQAFHQLQRGNLTAGALAPQG
jgi:hypothetical protein